MSQPLVSSSCTARIGRHVRLGIAALALTLLGAGSARAGIVVVAADGSGDFTSISAAAIAAADGDTLLVRPGTYAGFAVGTNKSVTVMADGSGPVTVNGYVAVVNSPVGKTIVISGLTTAGNVGSAGPVQGHAFIASNCAGTVRVQNCDFTGAAGDPEGWAVGHSSFEVTGHAAGWHAALVQNCSGTITFNDCSFRGGDAPDMTSFSTVDCGCTYGEPGGDALRIENGTVALADCTGLAGFGATADRTGGNGGAGIRVVSGHAVVSGCDFQGGHGGSALDYIGDVYGGNGGHGVHAGAGTDTALLDNVLAGGGEGYSLSGHPGDAGQGLGGVGAAATVAYPGHARQLGISAPAYVGGSVTLDLDGLPGDLFLLQLSTGNGWLPSAKFHGVLSVGLPAISLAIGALPPSGHLQLGSTVPPIAPLQTLNIYLQAIAGTPSDAALTGEAILILVDPAGL